MNASEGPLIDPQILAGNVETVLGGEKVVGNWVKALGVAPEQMQYVSDESPLQVGDLCLFVEHYDGWALQRPEIAVPAGTPRIGNLSPKQIIDYEGDWWSGCFIWDSNGVPAWYQSRITTFVPCKVSSSPALEARSLVCATGQTSRGWRSILKDQLIAPPYPERSFIKWPFPPCQRLDEMLENGTFPWITYKYIHSAEILHHRK